MRPKTYALLEQCVEDGINRWAHRCEKLDITEPNSEISKDLLHDAIMEEIDQWFDFDTTADVINRLIQNAEHR